MTKQEPNPYAYGYARMPRIIRKGYKNLTNMQKLLYIYLRDLCGEDGTCYRSLRSLKDETGFSIGYLSVAIPILHNEGLIHAEMRKTSSTHWEVWHISVIDIWEKNAAFLQAEKAKCSPDEQMNEQSVQDMNRSVHQMNKIAESVQEVNESVHTMILNKNHTNNQLTENNNREEIVATSAEDRNAPALIDFTEQKEKRKTDPRIPVVKPYDMLANNPIIHTRNPYHGLDPYPFGYRSDLVDADPINQEAWRKALQAKEEAVVSSHSHADIGNDDVPTVKLPAIPKQTPAPGMSFVEARDYLRGLGYFLEPTPSMNGWWEIREPYTNGFDVIKGDQVIRRAEYIRKQQTPAAGVPAISPHGSDASAQALSVSFSGADAAQRTASPGGAVQASIPKRPGSRKVTQANVDAPVPMPKSDTREIQRRINEHRGYALEEKVDIVRERQAIKTWCNLHTLEEYGLVMSGAKNDKYWGKQENYYRIGGLTLLKITPEILARQRQPLPMAANGNGHQSDMEGLVSQNGLVLWQGQWMTEEEANETGFNGGFGLYK